ncbi:hypothetical protein C8F01DRAFT_1243973 [Mycena amicta]|nr:hypothetical protein C8F01DRAFT_1243973 [Mycena amicta]
MPCYQSPRCGLTPNTDIRRVEMDVGSQTVKSVYERQSWTTDITRLTISNLIAALIGVRIWSRLDNIAAVAAAPVGARSIYIWDLHLKTTLEDLRTLAPADVVESIRHEPKNQCAFITFVDPVVALMFFQTSVSLGLKLNGYRLRLGWGKVYYNTPQLTVDVQDVKIFNEERLRDDFGEFGVVYSVRLYETTAVVTFTNIPDARNAIKTMRKRPQYSGLKIKHADDSALPSPTVFIGIANGFKIPFTEEQLRADLGEFGTIEHIQFSGEDKVFVRFTDILSAAKALNAIYTRPEYAGLRLRYGRYGRDEYPSYNGPTPDVYIGQIQDFAVFTEERLMADWAEFGPILSVRIIPERNCAIVEFENTPDTIRAIEVLKTRPEYMDLEVRHMRVRFLTAGEVRAKGKTSASANGSGKDLEGVESSVTGRKPLRKGRGFSIFLRR